MSKGREEEEEIFSLSGTTHANESVEVREQRGKGSGVASRTSSLSTEPWETMLGGAAQYGQPKNVNKYVQ